MTPPARAPGNQPETGASQSHAPSNTPQADQSPLLAFAHKFVRLIRQADQHPIRRVVDALAVGVVACLTVVFFSQYLLHSAADSIMMSDVIAPVR